MAKDLGKLREELKQYQRPVGTSQCMDSIEVRQPSFDGGGRMRFWAVCFREKGHPGPHRHWLPIDWTGANEAMSIRRGLKKRRR